MYFVELGVKGLVYGCMYAMMAVGLTLVYGLLRILHIAHAGVFALGAFVTVVVANETGSLALGFALAIVVSAVAGVAIYRFAYQPLLGHAAFVPMIVSIGIFIVMQEGFRMVFGAYGIAFDYNPYYTATVDLAGIRLNYVEIAMVVAATVLLVGFGLFASLTRAGIGWRATVTDLRFGPRRHRRRAGRLVEQLRRADDGRAGELQGARHHRAGRPGQRARHPDRQPGPGCRRVLRHDLSRRYLRPRRDRLFVPDRGVDGAAAGPAGTRMRR
jgi:hypothetical protein